MIATDQKGSLAYMAPERLRGEPHGTASDVWSVGVTLAELVLGDHPFIPADKCRGFGSTERFWALAEVLRHTASHEECQVAVASAVDAALRKCTEKTASSALQRFLARCLRAQPSERASVSELLDDPFILALRPRE
jgi:serine/threonine protein kinase